PGGASYGGAGSFGTDSTPDGDQAGHANWPSTAGAATAASSGGGSAPGRTSSGKGGDHVPGGPTSATDGSDSLPSPFIEGGKDPKIR
ncbi:hypothetical protein, partial [Promicromonospora kroppenstedtii]|uniref:hypothetical protein n=1 Tax=Promicromonospora kroppenstedtii TaxID=440482 RepID=UPI003CCC39A9